MGNPPYGANQKSANDNAKKRKYGEGIDKRIEESYLNGNLFTKEKEMSIPFTTTISVRSVGRPIVSATGTDNSIRQSERLAHWQRVRGIQEVYRERIFEDHGLRSKGDQNSGNWRQEGEKIFGEGSKIGIAITLLVKNVKIILEKRRSNISRHRIMPSDLKNSIF